LCRVKDRKGRAVPVVCDKPSSTTPGARNPRSDP
jgi:hypothetical protein